MSLERELVFQLRRDGSSEADVLEIIAIMGNPDILKTKPVKLNHKLVNVALSQYNAAEELKKRKDYVKTDGEKLKELIEKKREEIRNTTEDLLSVTIWKMKSNPNTSTVKYNCKNCSGNTLRYYAEITCLNGKGGIPTPVKKREDLFYHCSNCGYTSDTCKD